MLAGHPKLRDDLITSRQETPDGVLFVVKDPATRRFFRLREAEHLIARQLDGCTALDALQPRLEHEFGVTVPSDTLRQFVEQLRRLGLLETGEQSRCERPLRQRIAGNPLYIRLKAFDPDRLLDRMIDKVWFCFTPWFVTLSLTLVAVAVAITVSYGDEIVRDFGRLYRFDALLLAWITMLLVTAGHEFAHGLTCKRFGGEVHEMGFLLLYFQPAFYCNISDAWLFPRKSQRLWVTFAGAFFEISVWALATLTWWMTETDTWVNFVAMIIMATSAIKSFFNLNPLIKLDGYYLLSDYLEIPNLRQRSFKYLKTSVARLWNATASATTVPRRERLVYVSYGVLAGVYSFWLLGIIALRFGNFLVERYQGPGFLAFSGLLMVAFQNPLRTAARKLPPAFRRDPRKSLEMKRPVVRLALLVLALAVLFLGRLELKVSGEFTALPARNADVRAPVDAIIEHVLVQEGDRVRVGDVLVRLSDRDYRAELEKVDAEIAERQATLKMLRAGPRPEEINLSRDEIRTARTRHEHARRRYEEADQIRATRLSKAEAAASAAEERLQYTRADLGRFTELFELGLISRRQLEPAGTRAAAEGAGGSAGRAPDGEGRQLFRDPSGAGGGADAGRRSGWQVQAARRGQPARND